jgi:GNAT superfamily N-acetyltransferase
MIITIIKVDDPELLDHICIHLFKEWKAIYTNIWNIHSPTELTKLYSGSHQTTLMAALDDNGKFLGCYSYTRKGNIKWIGDVYVVPQERSKGYGRMIMENAMANEPMVALKCEPHLVSYYKKLGFVCGLMYEMKNNDTGFKLEYFHMLYDESQKEEIKSNDAFLKLYNYMAVIIFIMVLLILIIWWW